MGGGFWLGGRFLLFAGFVGLLVGYGLLTAAMMKWDWRALVLAGGAALAMLAGPLLVQVLLRRPPRFSLVGFLARTTFVLSLLLVTLLTLMRSGFLLLTTDRPVLFVELTGETRPQMVRFMPPDQPLQERTLRAHRIVLRSAQKNGTPGDIVGETWLYGDEVAIKGRVLRLSPMLNAAGMANLFALTSIHNGYFTPERHNQLPHHAEALRPLGPLAVPPTFLALRDCLLSRWERTSHDQPPGSNFAIRAATTESTYFPLIDAQGQPIRHCYPLVLTSGGLTAG